MYMYVASSNLNAELMPDCLELWPKENECSFTCLSLQFTKYLLQLFLHPGLDHLFSTSQFACDFEKPMPN